MYIITSQTRAGSSDVNNLLGNKPVSASEVTLPVTSRDDYAVTQQENTASCSRGSMDRIHLLYDCKKVLRLRAMPRYPPTKRGGGSITCIANETTVFEASSKN